MLYKRPVFKINGKTETQRKIQGQNDFTTSYLSSKQ
jgi:hypothetical protein